MGRCALSTSLLVVWLAVPLFLSGCGGDSDDTTETTSSAATTATTTTTAPKLCPDYHTCECARRGTDQTQMDASLQQAMSVINMTRNNSTSMRSSPFADDDDDVVDFGLIREVLQATVNMLEATKKMAAMLIAHPSPHNDSGTQACKSLAIDTQEVANLEETMTDQILLWQDLFDDRDLHGLTRSARTLQLYAHSIMNASDLAQQHASTVGLTGQYCGCGYFDGIQLFRMFTQMHDLALHVADAAMNSNDCGEINLIDCDLREEQKVETDGFAVVKRGVTWAANSSACGQECLMRPGCSAWNFGIRKHDEGRHNCHMFGHEEAYPKVDWNFALSDGEWHSGRCRASLQKCFMRAQLDMANHSEAIAKLTNDFVVGGGDFPPPPGCPAEEKQDDLPCPGDGYFEEDSQNRVHIAITSTPTTLPGRRLTGSQLVMVAPPTAAPTEAPTTTSVTTPDSSSHSSSLPALKVWGVAVGVAAISLFVVWACEWGVLQQEEKRKPVGIEVELHPSPPGTPAVQGLQPSAPPEEGEGTDRASQCFFTSTRGARSATATGPQEERKTTGPQEERRTTDPWEERKRTTKNLKEEKKRNEAVNNTVNVRTDAWMAIGTTTASVPKQNATYIMTPSSQRHSDVHWSRALPGVAVALTVFACIMLFNGFVLKQSPSSSLSQSPTPSPTPLPTPQLPENQRALLDTGNMLAGEMSAHLQMLSYCQQSCEPVHLAFQNASVKFFLAMTSILGEESSRSLPSVISLNQAVGFLDGADPTGDNIADTAFGHEEAKTWKIHLGVLGGDLKNQQLDREEGGPTNYDPFQSSAVSGFILVADMVGSEHIAEMGTSTMISV